MSEIMDDIAYLSQEIGPRPAGTEEEQQAAQYIAEQMREQTGFSTTIEEFHCVPEPGIAEAICYGIAAILSMIAAFVSPAVVPAFFITLACTIVAMLELSGKPVLSRVFKQGVSQNVISKYQPAPSNTPGRGARKIVIVARYDSGRIQNELNGKSANSYPSVKKASIAALIALPVLLLFRIMFLRAAGAGILFLGILIFIAAIIALVPAILFLRSKSASYNEAANSNAAGVAVMMEAARRIAAGQMTEEEIERLAEEGSEDEDEDDYSAYTEEYYRPGEAFSEEVPAADMNRSYADQPEGGLAAAKAAVAAITGEPIAMGGIEDVADKLAHFGNEDAVVMDEGAMREQREATMRVFEGVDTSSLEEDAKQQAQATQPTNEPVQQELPDYVDEAEEAQAAEGFFDGQPLVEGASEDVPETADDGIVIQYAPQRANESSMPDWYVTAREKANSHPNGSFTPIRRSRYADALDAKLPKSEADQAPEEPEVIEPIPPLVISADDDVVEAENVEPAIESGDYIDVQPKKGHAGESVGLFDPGLTFNPVEQADDETEEPAEEVAEAVTTPVEAFDEEQPEDEYEVVPETEPSIYVGEEREGSDDLAPASVEPEAADTTANHGEEGYRLDWDLNNLESTEWDDEETAEEPAVRDEPKSAVDDFGYYDDEAPFDMSLYGPAEDDDLDDFADQPRFSRWVENQSDEDVEDDATDFEEDDLLDEEPEPEFEDVFEADSKDEEEDERSEEFSANDDSAKDSAPYFEEEVGAQRILDIDDSEARLWGEGFESPLEVADLLDVTVEEDANDDELVDAENDYDVENRTAARLDINGAARDALREYSPESLEYEVEDIADEDIEDIEEVDDSSAIEQADGVWHEYGSDEAFDEAEDEEERETSPVHSGLDDLKSGAKALFSKFKAKIQDDEPENAEPIEEEQFDEATDEQEFENDEVIDEKNLGFESHPAVQLFDPSLHSYASEEEDETDDAVEQVAEYDQVELEEEAQSFEELDEEEEDFAATGWERDSVFLRDPRPEVVDESVEDPEPQAAYQPRTSENRVTVPMPSWMEFEAEQGGDAGANARNARASQQNQNRAFESHDEEAVVEAEESVNGEPAEAERDLYIMDEVDDYRAVEDISQYLPTEDEVTDFATHEDEEVIIETYDEPEAGIIYEDSALEAEEPIEDEYAYAPIQQPESNGYEYDPSEDEFDMSLYGEGFEDEEFEEVVGSALQIPEIAVEDYAEAIEEEQEADVESAFNSEPSEEYRFGYDHTEEPIADDAANYVEETQPTAIDEDVELADAQFEADEVTAYGEPVDDSVVVEEETEEPEEDAFDMSLYGAGFDEEAFDAEMGVDSNNFESVVYPAPAEDVQSYEAEEEAYREEEVLAEDEASRTDELLLDQEREDLDAVYEEESEEVYEEEYASDDQDDLEEDQNQVATWGESSEDEYADDDEFSWPAEYQFSDSDEQAWNSSSVDSAQLESVGEGFEEEPVEESALEDSADEGSAVEGDPYGTSYDYYEAEEEDYEDPLAEVVEDTYATADESSQEYDDEVQDQEEEYAQYGAYDEYQEDELTEDVNSENVESDAYAREYEPAPEANPAASLLESLKNRFLNRAPSHPEVSQNANRAEWEEDQNEEEYSEAEWDDAEYDADEEVEEADWASTEYAWRDEDEVVEESDEDEEAEWDDETLYNAVEENQPVWSSGSIVDEEDVDSEYREEYAVEEPMAENAYESDEYVTETDTATADELAEADGVVSGEYIPVWEEESEEEDSEEAQEGIAEDYLSQFESEDDEISRAVTEFDDEEKAYAVVEEEKESEDSYFSDEDMAVDFDAPADVPEGYEEVEDDELDESEAFDEAYVAAAANEDENIFEDDEFGDKDIEFLYEEEEDEYDYSDSSIPEPIEDAEEDSAADEEEVAFENDEEYDDGLGDVVEDIDDEDELSEEVQYSDDEEYYEGDVEAEGLYQESNLGDGDEMGNPNDAFGTEDEPAFDAELYGSDELWDADDSDDDQARFAEIPFVKAHRRSADDADSTTAIDPIDVTDLRNEALSEREYREDDYAEDADAFQSNVPEGYVAVRPVFTPGKHKKKHRLFFSFMRDEDDQDQEDDLTGAGDTASADNYDDSGDAYGSAYEGAREVLEDAQPDAEQEYDFYTQVEHDAQRALDTLGDEEQMTARVMNEMPAFEGDEDSYAQVNDDENDESTNKSEREHLMSGKYDDSYNREPEGEGGTRSSRRTGGLAKYEMGAANLEPIDPSAFANKARERFVPAAEPVQREYSKPTPRKRSQRNIVLPEVGVDENAGRKTRARVPLGREEEERRRRLLDSSRIPRINADGTGTSKKNKDSRRRSLNTIPSLSGEIRARREIEEAQKRNKAANAGTMTGAAGATGAFSPVGDALSQGASKADLYVDDADDSSYGSKKDKRNNQSGDDRNWYGGAYSKRRANAAAANESDADPAYSAEEYEVMESEAEAIEHLRNPDVNTEVWFVALGSELSYNGGMNAFLDYHAQDLRGAIVVNLESLGAGDMTYIESEGVLQQRKPSSRIKRYLRKAMAITGISPASAKIDWRESAASVAMKHGVQSMSLVGMDGAKPAYYAQGDDVLENISPAKLEKSVKFVLGLIKNI